MKTIYFDMDGTIANLYGVDGWLEDLTAGKVRPYAEATPLLDMAELTNELLRLQALGYKLGIVSWLSKTGTPQYNREVTATKKQWLAEKLPLIVWDENHIVEYGTPKSSVVSEKTGILFDDEKRNRVEWMSASAFGIAFNVSHIIGILRSLF